MLSVLAAFALSTVAVAADLRVERAEMVRKINSVQSSWTASLDSPTALLSLSESRALTGGLIRRSTLPRKAVSNAAPVPKSFDSRVAWPVCPTIKEIRDQASCGSCWAFGAVESMSDRFCIFNGEVVRLSAEDANSCSGEAGSCQGGYADRVFEYMRETGVVTEDCYPYSIPSCDHHVENSTSPCGDIVDTPQCIEQCTGDSTRKWKADKHHVYEAYCVEGEENIMAEIAQNGPCEVGFDVYEDFLTYKSGIYHHVYGTSDSGHYVKVIGYGVEKGEKYWLLSNSWNVHWGEQGFFRMRRGTNEGGIEDCAHCGIPKPKFG